MINEKNFKEEISKYQNEIINLLYKGDLDEKQQVFVIEYFKDFSRSKAYRRAFHTDKKSIYTLANTIYFECEEIIEEIATLLIKKSNIEVLKIITRLNEAATFNLKDLYDENNRLKNIHDMPDQATRLIESIEITQKSGVEIDGKGNIKSSPSDTIKIKIPARMKANEMLSKYYGLYSDNEIKIEGFTSLVDLVKKKYEKDEE